MNINVVGGLTMFIILIVALYIGSAVINSTQDQINNRQLLCNQWCCGNVDKNGNLAGYCTDTLYDVQTDECVYVLSGQRMNWSDKVCPYKITQVLN